MLNHKEIAEIAHEQNRIYCVSIGDNSQIYWDGAPEWQKTSAINGVDAIAKGTINGPGASHANWLSEKEANGWVYGKEKDSDTKEHPCIVPFQELPADQRFKDFLFYHTVSNLLQLSEEFAHA